MQPKACPAYLTHGRVLQLPEWLENHLKGLRRYPHAGVAHPEIDASLVAPGRHRHASCCGKFHRIANQVLEDDLELTRIGVKHGQVRLDVPDKGQARLLLEGLSFRLYLL